MKCDFNQIESVQRGIILVASEEKYSELTSEVDWKKLLWGTLITALPWGISISLLASSVTATSLAAIGITNKKSLRDFLKKGEIPIHHLSPSEAANRFGFDHGHPQNGTAYVLHATNPDYYLLPAIANERLAQEKVAAFFKLVSSLGAKKMELISAEVLEKNIKGKADVPLPEAAAQIGIDASFSAKGDVNRKVYAEFTQPSNLPSIPDDLKGWLNVDPVFKSLSTTRLEGTLIKTKASLTIESSVDFGAAAQTAIKSFKVDVGGKYHKVSKSVWSFDIEFWENKETSTTTA